MRRRQAPATRAHRKRAATRSRACNLLHAEGCGAALLRLRRIVLPTSVLRRGRALPGRLPPGQGLAFPGDFADSASKDRCGERSGGSEDHTPHFSGVALTPRTGTSPGGRGVTATSARRSYPLVQEKRVQSPANSAGYSPLSQSLSLTTVSQPPGRRSAQAAESRRGGTSPCTRRSRSTIADRRPPSCPMR
jgi:hypothetical protein